jgi:tRNA-(ms[2]io[6]A)-hydroxylase
MLCLKCSTNPKWIDAAIKDLDNVMIDHAHCEKKAAATGLSLISNYPEKTEISLTMSDLVVEEIGHYKSVVEILDFKGIILSYDKGDPYVKDLLSHVRNNEPERLLDRLITAAIIEARSCERLQILGDGLEDETLKDFYSKLSATEAGHYVTFIKLANLYVDEEEVKKRIDELTEIEKNIVVSLPNHPTIHG